jgi:RimJ/RimL family protein N-acetyltransferase
MTDTEKSGTEVPVIETERLVLRPHLLTDFAACVAMWSDPRITRYTIGEPSSAQRTWLRILAYRGHWALLGFGYWAVEEKASGRYVGELGFADFKREIQPSIEGIPELGWALAFAAHNKGYATEALRAAVVWGDKNIAEARTVCLISPNNAASLRVAAKIGYRETGRTKKNGEAEILFERLR